MRFFYTDVQDFLEKYNFILVSFYLRQGWTKYLLYCTVAVHSCLATHKLTFVMVRHVQLEMVIIAILN